MTSKTERRRRKRASRSITLPGGTAVTARKTQGQRDMPENPQKTALEARCRVAGCPTTREALDALRAPLWGCDVGRCIADMTGRDEQARLWQVWCTMTAARRNWLQRSIGLTGDPANSNLPMLPEPMETDPGLTVDLRTAEERDRDARNADAYWSGLVDGVQWFVARVHLRLAVSGMGGPWWQEGKPTAKGKAMVRGLREVADMAEGRRENARG